MQKEIYIDLEVVNFCTFVFMQDKIRCQYNSLPNSVELLNKIKTKVFA